MKNTVIREIETVQTTLAVKVKELRDTKEQAIVNTKLNHLREALLSVIERVMETVHRKVEGIVNPLSHLNEEI